MPFSFGDDDGGFREFNFFVSLSPSPQQHNPHHHHHHHHHQQQDRDDDDWGDFVQSPQNNSIPQPSSSPPHNNGKWEKPTGAIPLSIFGDEEEEEEPPEPTQFLFNNNNNNGFSSPSTTKPFARDVMDLISDLYAQPPPPANASTGSDLPKEKDNCEDGDVDNDDDNSWEYKDAFSPINGRGDGDGIQAAGNGLETVLEASDQLRVRNGGNEPCLNLYSAQDRGVNGLNFDSDIAHGHFISGTPRHSHCTSNGNGMHPSLENGVESIDDKMWDFKDAFTRGAVESGSLGKQKTPPYHEPHMFMCGSKVQASGDWFVSSRGDLLTSTSAEGKEEFSGSSMTLNGSLSGPNSVQTEIKALDPVVACLNSGCQIDKGLSCYSTPNSCLDFYHRLKEESIFLIIHHLGDLKKSHGAALSGEEAKILKINENIQEVYKVLHEAKISENAYIGKHSSKGACVNQLVEVTKEPYFWALEEEYRLSERILSVCVFSLWHFEYDMALACKQSNV